MGEQVTAQLQLFTPQAPPRPVRCRSCEWYSGGKCHEVYPQLPMSERANACGRIRRRRLLLPGGGEVLP